jgi:hypothetical protein
MSFKRGDFVTITTATGNTTRAMVRLASENGRSLFLTFDGALWGTHGAYFGNMALLRDDDGVFRDLIESEPMQVVAASTCPRCGRTSHNPTDIAQGYCGACHDWTTPR